MHQSASAEQANLLREMQKSYTKLGTLASKIMQAYLSVPNAWIIRSAMHCNSYLTHLFDRTGSSCMFQILCFFVRYIRSFICLLVKNNSNAAMLSGSYRCSDKKQISLVQSTPTAALWGPRTWASRVCIGGSCITHFQNNTKLEALGTQVSRNCANIATSYTRTASMLELSLLSSEPR